MIPRKEISYSLAENSPFHDSHTWTEVIPLALPGGWAGDPPLLYLGWLKRLTLQKQRHSEISQAVELELKSLLALPHHEARKYKARSLAFWPRRGKIEELRSLKFSYRLQEQGHITLAA